MGNQLLGWMIIAGMVAAAVGIPAPAGSETPAGPQAPDHAALPTIGIEYEPVYGDIVFKRLVGETGQVPPTVFSHWTHRMRFRCYVCHDSIFKMKKGSNKVVKDDIRAGKYCGVCHTGRLAWEITDENCHLCHKGTVSKPVAEKKP